MISDLRKGLTKNVVFLGIVSLLTDISSEMLYPIIPIFLTATLGAPMAVVGMIEGIAEATASILKAFSGWFSDRIRKRHPFVVGGYALSGIAKPMLALAYAWPAVLVARIVDRFGKGVRSAARDALLADSCAPEYRGKAFGFHRAMDTIGACIGPLAALWFLALLNQNMRAVFLIAFIPAVLGVILLIFFVKEAPSVARAAQPLLHPRAALSPQFLQILFISSIFAIGNSSDAFLILRAKNLGLSTALVIVAYTLYNLSYAALSTSFGSLSDRYPRQMIIGIGYIVFGLVYVGFAVAASRVAIWGLFFVYGFYMAMTDGVGKALITDAVPVHARGTALGIYYCVTGLLAFVASFVAGLLWMKLGAHAPFWYGAILACIAGIAFLVSAGNRTLRKA